MGRVCKGYIGTIGSYIGVYKGYVRSPHGNSPPAIAFEGRVVGTYGHDKGYLIQYIRLLQDSCCPQWDFERIAISSNPRCTLCAVLNGGIAS